MLKWCERKNIDLTRLASCFVKYDSTTWLPSPWIKRNAVLSRLTTERDHTKLFNYNVHL